MAKKVVIIEDDRDILDIMNLILSEEGYEVLASTDSSLLNEIPLHNPALILMDNRLTDGYGKDFCREFKNNPATQIYPVVLVSANSGLEEMARDSQADAYLKKPFDINDLLAIVKRFA